MRCTIFAFLALCSAPAWAEDAAAARAHYQKATNHFAVGEFNEAAESYQEAYKLKPDPALLFNAAQSFRLGGNNEKAIVLYRNYLNLYPRSRNAEEVREQIRKLEDAIEAQRRAKQQPPTGTMDPAQPQAQAQTQAQKTDKPVHKKWWFWTALAGAVVVVGAAVTVAVVLTRPESTPWNDLPSVGPNTMGLLVGASF